MKLKITEQMKEEIDRNLEAREKFMEIFENLKAEKKVDKLDESYNRIFFRRIKPYQFNDLDLRFYIDDLLEHGKLSDADYDFLINVITSEKEGYFCMDSTAVLSIIMKIYLEISNLSDEEIKAYWKAHETESKYALYIYRRAFHVKHYFLFDD